MPKRQTSTGSTPEAAADTTARFARMAEWTVESDVTYSDPFNDVVVDVVFLADDRIWRVPMFWAGGQAWTVRFAPPKSGLYNFRLECSDHANRSLNASGEVIIEAYDGPNDLYKKGNLHVSKSGRYFEHADGTPFLWLADTCWPALSGRLAENEFDELVADRVRKGFNVLQLCAGLSPSYEEVAPSDPGFSNKGGAVWDEDFHAINPAFFDEADRRINTLLDNGVVPALVGGWRGVLAQMGVPKMQQHWRYVVARYGAFPVVWIAGGEVYDPPEAERRDGLPFGATTLDLSAPGWTEVARYIRSVDPYGHPLTVHEIDPPYDNVIQDESLMDFDLFQAGHRGWPSVATEIALLNTHYARTGVTRPVLVGEINYEGLGGGHGADFQRAAFWLAMLNGAAGHAYGAVATWAAYSVHQPLHRMKFSFMNWREGLHLPGSYEVGLGAQLLRQYPWWRFEPHPEWVSPHGTTLLTPNKRVNGFDIDLIAALAQPTPPSDDDLPLGDWRDAKGNWRLPYAAGIPGAVRFIYMPNFGFKAYDTPTVLGLEPSVSYRAFYWEPSLGIKFDLGIVRHGASTPDISQVERELRDANGHYRGTLAGPGWDDWGVEQRIENDAYYPHKPPSMGDWLLILDNVAT